MSTKTINISIEETKSTFNTLNKLPLFKKNPQKQEQYDTSGVLELRQLLSHEKIRLLKTIKIQKPESIYKLAKILGRGFKSVNDDIKLLARLGFIPLTKAKTKNRRRYKPEIVIDTLTINLRV